MGNSSLVAADIFHDRNDVWTPLPFLRTMEKNLGFRYPGVTADSGYESEEAYTYLREQKQKPYIKPQTYEKWKKRSFKQDIVLSFAPALSFKTQSAPAGKLKWWKVFVGIYKYLS